MRAVADPGFLDGTPTPEWLREPITWQNVYRKLHKTKRNWPKGR